MFLAIIILFSACKKAIIEGEVFDGFGNPLTNVNVSIAETQFAATTNTKGEYTIGYVPGEIKLLFNKKGFIETFLLLNIATESKFPAKTVFLYKIPINQGIWLFGQDDYIQIKKGHISDYKTTKGRGFYKKQIASYSTFFNSSGDNFTSINKDSVLLFFDNDPNPIVLIKLNHLNGKFWQILEREYNAFGIHVGEYTDKSEFIKDTYIRIDNYDKGDIRKVKLDIGKYAYAHYTRGIPAIKEPIYLFEIIENAY